MKWFLTQSISTIALSFLLGTVLTWLYFRNRYRRVERSWTTQDDEALNSTNVEASELGARRTLEPRNAVGAVTVSGAPEAVALAMGRSETRASDSSRYDAERDAQTLVLRTEHDAALAAAATSHDSVLAELRAEHERTISGLTTTHQVALGGSAEGLAAAREEGDRAAADLRHRAETAETELGKVRAELAAAQSTIEERTSSLEAGRTELARLHGETESVRADTAREVDAARLDATRDVEAARSEAARLQGEIEQLRTSTESSAAAIDGVRAEVESAQSAAAQSAAEVETLRGELARARTEHDGLRVAHSSLQETHDTLQRAHDVLRTEHAASQTASRQAFTAGASVGLPSVGLRLGNRADEGPEEAGDGSETMNTARHLAPNVDGPVTTGTDGVVDDLERIEGIGPRICASLHAVGIRTFDSLAGASQERLRDALEQAGLNYAPSLPTWAEQAQLLASGNVAGFHEFVERLIAGRDAR